MAPVAGDAESYISACEPPKVQVQLSTDLLVAATRLIGLQQSPIASVVNARREVNEHAF